MEHRIVIVTSRNPADLPGIAATELDDCATAGWRLVTAYVVESPVNSMVAHHFVLQRPKQPTEIIEKGNLANA